MAGSLIFLAVIVAVIGVCWPTCTDRNQRIALVLTMVAVPYAAWLYWLPRHIVLIRRRRATELTQAHWAAREADLQFWESRLGSTVPAERDLAEQMLAYLGRPAAPIYTPPPMG